MLDYDRPASFPPGKFVVLPKTATDLPANALKVLLVAVDWPPAHRRRFSQAAVVAACADLGRDAVRTAFAELVAAGLLTAARRGPRWHYRLHLWDTTAVPDQRSAQPTAVVSQRSDEPTSVPSDEPTPIEQKDSKTPSALPRCAADGPQCQEESVDVDEHQQWLAAFTAALPPAARPAGWPSRLKVAAGRWLSHHPGDVAAAVAATLPATIHSPAGLLISRLEGGLEVGQVRHAAQRREFAARRAAADRPPTQPPVGVGEVADLAAAVRRTMVACL